jgi:hypothetical protein
VKLSNRSLPRPFITVLDAVTRYERSRSTIYRLLKARRLHYHRQPGDTRTDLSIEELDAVMRIRQAEKAAGNIGPRRSPARDEVGICGRRAD